MHGQHPSNYLHTLSPPFSPPSGIGNIPDAVLASLKGHKDLGIHSEMFSDGVVDLVEAGCITNTHKKYHPGKIVGSFIVGTRRLFDFVDNNPFVSECLGIFFCAVFSSQWDPLAVLQCPLYMLTLPSRPTVMCDVSFVNNIPIIAQNPKVTAINSCIEVDLTGQVVSDSIGTRMYSGQCRSLRCVRIGILLVCLGKI